ncbi:MAG: hypothetical protein AB7E21_15035 [Pseudodonghicola sp.]
MIFSDLGAALKISLPIIAMIILGLLLTPTTPEAIAAEAEPLSPVLWIALQLLGSVATLWVAVAWHRYVLLAEYPGSVLPRFHGGRVLAYFGWSLVLGVVLFALPGAVIALLAWTATGGVIKEPSAGVILPIVLAALVLVWVLARLSLVLPAAAIGERLGLRDSWQATRPIALGIIGLFALTFGFAMLLMVGVMLAYYALPLAGQIAAAVFQWIMTLLQLSILTTLYGVYVEGRSLD